MPVGTVRQVTSDGNANDVGLQVGFCAPLRYHAGSPPETRMNLNLSAPINRLGYGVVGLNVLRALSRHADVALWAIGAVEASVADRELLERARQRTAIFDASAPSVRLWHPWDLAQHVGKGKHCGFPIFELNRFTPAELHHLRAQDLVFTPSRWGAVVLAENGIPPDRIARAPFGVDTAVFHPRVAPARRPGRPEDTVFLNVGKWEIRKGHVELAHAFSRAFTSEDNVWLVLLCHNPFLPANEAWAWERRFLDTPLGNRVVILPRLNTQADVAAVLAGADCGVFPSRAEGWNLPLAEMLAMGKPVIATNYSAHIEFCNAGNAHLIDIDQLEDAHDGRWFHGQGQWAALGLRQLDQLVEHLRAIHRQKQTGKLGVNQAGLDALARIPWDATATSVLRAL
jgi:glycosyltransferase involved in cell wall biosynthesis